MKKIYFVLALTCISVLSYAQQGFHKVNVGAEVALPLGNFGKAYGVGLGATGKAFYGISEQGDITGTLGYMRFGMKDANDMMSGSMGMVPIMFGYRHDFGGLYGEPQLGLMLLSSKVKFNDMGLGLSGLSGTHSQTKVSFGLGGGYMFGDWDLGARFQIIDNLNFLGLRIGYNFSL
jgi:hypothetical protein